MWENKLNLIHMCSLLLFKIQNDGRWELWKHPCCWRTLYWKFSKVCNLNEAGVQDNVGISGPMVLYRRISEATRLVIWYHRNTMVLSRDCRLANPIRLLGLAKDRNIWPQLKTRCHCFTSAKHLLPGSLLSVAQSHKSARVVELLLLPGNSPKVIRCHPVVLRAFHRTSSVNWCLCVLVLRSSQNQLFVNDTATGRCQLWSNISEAVNSSFAVQKLMLQLQTMTSRLKAANRLQISQWTDG